MNKGEEDDQVTTAGIVTGKGCKNSVRLALDMSLCDAETLVKYTAFSEAGVLQSCLPGTH